MKVRNETLKIEEIKPNPWNPNEMVESMFNYLRDSKNWFGDLIDIIVWEQDNGDKTIIDGEHRYRADKENGKETVNCKILTTDELLEMANGLVKLSENKEEFISFKEIENFSDRQEKAEFIAKCLTIVMNSIKGENNSEKLANMFKWMEENSSVQLMSTLLHMKEDAIEGYRYLLEEHNDEAENRIRAMSSGNQMNDIKLIFQPEEWEQVKDCLKHIKSKGGEEGIMNIVSKYLEIKGIEVAEQ